MPDDTYTLDDDDLRELALAALAAPIFGMLDVTTSQAEAQYDRWLAAHDARVKAEALRDAADEFARGAWVAQWGADQVDDDISAVDSTGRWFRQRADTIEKEAGA